MHFKTVLAHLKSKIFSIGQPWWSTFFHIETCWTHIFVLNPPLMSSARKLFSEWFLLSLQLRTNILQIGAGFVIRNRSNSYYKSGQSYYKSGQNYWLQIGACFMKIYFNLKRHYHLNTFRQIKLRFYAVEIECSNKLSHNTSIFKKIFWLTH